jgi:hypothetical protein
VRKIFDATYPFFLADIIGGVTQEFVTQGEISQSTNTPVPFSKSPLACPPF